MKNVTRSVLCAVTAAYLAVTGSVIAGSDSDVKMIKVLRDDDTVTLHTGDGLVTEIPKEALTDKEQLRSYLGSLDEKDQEVVLGLLSGIEEEGHHKVMKLTKFLDKVHGENTKVMVLGKDHLDLELDEQQIIVDTDVHVHRLKEGHGIEKHIFVDIHDDLAHKKTILRLLEKGDFTQAQLDEIQQALDSKR